MHTQYIHIHVAYHHSIVTLPSKSGASQDRSCVFCERSCVFCHILCHMKLKYMYMYSVCTCILDPQQCKPLQTRLDNPALLIHLRMHSRLRQIFSQGRPVSTERPSNTLPAFRASQLPYNLANAFSMRGTHSCFLCACIRNYTQTRHEIIQPIIAWGKKYCDSFRQVGNIHCLAIVGFIFNLSLACMYMYVCMLYVCACTCMYACMYIHVCTYVCTCMYVCIVYVACFLLHCYMMIIHVHVHT